MKSLGKLKKSIKLQRLGAEAAASVRAQEQTIHRVAMATHQAVVKLWFGSSLPVELEQQAVAAVFQKLTTANEAFDVLEFLAPLVSEFKTKSSTSEG